MSSVLLFTYLPNLPNFLFSQCTAELIALLFVYSRLSVIIIIIIINVIPKNNGFEAERIFFSSPSVLQSSKYFGKFSCNLCNFKQFKNPFFLHLSLNEGIVQWSYRVTCCTTQVVNFWLKFTISPTLVLPGPRKI